MKNGILAVTFLAFGAMLLPQIAFAGPYDFLKGIVPCGNETVKADDPGARQTVRKVTVSVTGKEEKSQPFILDKTGTIKDPCDFEDLLEGANRLIDFALAVSVPLAMIVFAYAGFLYLTSAGSQSRMDKAKGLFKPVLIGFLWILTAWLVVSFIIKGLTSSDVSKGVHDSFLEENKK